MKETGFSAPEGELTFWVSFYNKLPEGSTVNLLRLKQLSHIHFLTHTVDLQARILDQLQYREKCS